MADDESPLLRDIRISDAGMYLTNEDSISHVNLIGIDRKLFEKLIHKRYVFII
jgi:hypothetical protein